MATLNMLLLSIVFLQLMLTNTFHNHRAVMKQKLITNVVGFQKEHTAHLADLLTRRGFRGTIYAADKSKRRLLKLAERNLGSEVIKVEPIILDITDQSTFTDNHDSNNQNERKLKATLTMKARQIAAEKSKPRLQQLADECFAGKITRDEYLIQKKKTISDLQEEILKDLHAAEVVQNTERKKIKERKKSKHYSESFKFFSCQNLKSKQRIIRKNSKFPN